MFSRRPIVCCLHGLIAVSAVILAPLEMASAVEPLHARIDRTVAAASFGSGLSVADDGEFLRRIYLDLAGTIPPAAVVREFLDDRSATKRLNIVDRLLDSPAYVRHMANVLDVMLMERRRDKHLKGDEWQKYLRESVAENKPWNQLAREVLSADGTDSKIRAAAKFYLDREVETNLLTRDVGRIFFGMDLQCCQCHDHPVIGDYYQAHYYGIFAFLNRGFLFTDKDKKVFYAEKAEGDVEFKSVFTDEQGSTRPCLPGQLEIADPVFAVGDEYQVEPAAKARPVPKYSRRAKLGELAASGQNQAFNRNIANRLWAHMMGQGLVAPLDLHHTDNPPAHPELLEMLAAEFVSMGFNIKAFLRELALTQTYQRSLASKEPRQPPAAAQLTELSAELERRREVQTKALSAYQAAAKEFDRARDEANQADAEFKKASAGVRTALKKVNEDTQKLAAAQQKLSAERKIAQALAEAAEKAAAAAEQLSNDPELTSAAELFRSRATKRASAVTAAQTSIDKIAPVASASQQALQTARAEALSVQRKLERANAALSEFNGPLLTLAQRLDSAERAVLQTKAQLDDAQLVARDAELANAHQLATADIEAKRQELAATRKQLAQFVAELPQLQTEVATAQQAHGQATGSLQEARAQVAAQKELVQLVADAANSAEAACKQLPKDAELKQAYEKVKSRRDQVAEQVEQLKNEEGQRQKEAAVIGARLAAAQRTAQGTAEQIAKLEQLVGELTEGLTAYELRAEQARLDRDEVRDRLEQRSRARFVTASLGALSPEQMAWSIMQATGALDQQRRAAEAELNKQLPLAEQDRDNSQKLAERDRAREELLSKRLRGQVNAFVKLFGHAAGQPQNDFFATVDQALFFSNAGTLQGWLKPSGGNLTDRLNKLDDPRAIAEELYISVLTRRPSDDETADVVAYLAERPAAKKVDALKEMAWALITSAEFRFSH